jgi:hypothetical protein
MPTRQVCSPLSSVHRDNATSIHISLISGAILKSKLSTYSVRVKRMTWACFGMLIDNFWTASNPIMGNTSSSTVQKCLEGALGKDVAFKSDPLFQLSHVKPYNLGISSTPAAVTYPKTADQVGAIVKCAVDNSLKVQPRCGGHSYANYGTCLVLHKDGRISGRIRDL